MARVPGPVLNRYSKTASLPRSSCYFITLKCIAKRDYSSSTTTTATTLHAMRLRALQAVAQGTYLRCVGTRYHVTAERRGKGDGCYNKQEQKKQKATRR